MNIVIGVATHKNYRIPRDKIYKPIHAGRRLKFFDHKKSISVDNMLYQYDGDDVGDNISRKNPNYCELTVLYSLWKNCDADYIGLCHYRRYFKGCGKGDLYDKILTGEQAEKILRSSSVVLPKKRNYFIETNYSQYVHAHHKEDLDVTLEIIKEKYPLYTPVWAKVMADTKGHRFNMLIMRKDILDRYCRWLFDILFRLEERLDISQYSENDKRVFGFVAERLLDVWIETNNITYIELPVLNTEKQNWPKKIYSFLRRKFKGKK